MSQVDQKRAFNKLKHDLEPWRNLIVSLNSLLTWEKQFYPGIILGIISLFYLLLWILDFSTVTLLALGGLFAVAADFTYPSVSRFVFSPDWSGAHEVQFETVCELLCNLKITLSAWYEFLFNNKERKSTMFVIITSVVLVFLAWIGAVINNLLLMYFVTLGVAFYPGVKEKNVFKTLKETFGCAVNSKIQQLREKTKKSD